MPEDQPESTPVDDAIDGGQELLAEIGTLVPRFVDRTVQQARFAAAVFDRVVCGRTPQATESLDEPAIARGGPPPRDELAPLRSLAENGSEPQPPSAPADDVGDLAIPGYDELAASQVVPRLEGLDAAELEAIRNYEVSHRGRRTILGRISQLQD